MELFDCYLSTLRKYNDKYMVKEPSYYVMKLAEETGEVAEASIAALGSSSKKEKLKLKGITPLEALQEELGDVLNVLLTIGQSFGLTPQDIVAAAQDKIQVRNAKKEQSNGERQR